MESNVEILCREKAEELLRKYFEDSNPEFELAGGDPEKIGDYTKDLPLKIEAEYREFLVELWKEYSDQPLVLEEQKLRWLMTEDNREEVDITYEDAKRITLWERITKTNYKDVHRYRWALHDYAKDLLLVMRTDFLEEITGKEINCKAFRD